jgi:pyruvate/2-oxoglutarate dehydrogenase complex dihydrolipoamide acyltransferase (E2) component
MIEVPVPRESVNDESVVVQAILVPDGQLAAKGQAVVEVETSKTAVAVAAPSAGQVRHNLEVGQEVEVGACLFRIVGDSPHSAASLTSHTASKEDDVSNRETLAQPTPGPAPLLSRAAQAALDAGTDLSSFSGRWVTRADVLALRDVHVERASSRRGPDPGRGGAPEAGTAERRILPQERFKPVSRGKRKRVEVQNLLRGGHAATTSTIGAKLILPGDRIVAPSPLFRSNISDLLVYEGARVLRKFPELNGFNLDDQTMGLYEDINFGLSFDSGQNLKVLVLRTPDRKSLSAIQDEFTELLELYEGGGSIPRERLEGATVTLSDLSPTGASFMLPLLNGQQGLIIGIVSRNRREFDLLASFDHRLSEGLRVARFLEELRERVLSHFRDPGGTANLRCDGCGKSMQDEVRLGSRGFVRIILPSGEEGGFCRNCFEGH